MIRLSLDQNDLVIGSDEADIERPDIRGILIDTMGFHREENGLRLTGPVTSARIEQVSEYLRFHFSNLKIGDDAQQLLDQHLNQRADGQDRMDNAMDQKRLIEARLSDIPDVNVPRLTGTLEWYQRIGVLHALSIRNSANFSVPGSGKTWMAYSTYFKMNDELHDVDRLLVIGPKVAYTAWQREYRLMTEVAPNIANITGTRTQRAEIFANHNAEIYFINYALLPREIDNIIDMLRRERFLVVADESHHFKGINSQAANAFRQIAEHCERRMILTGTMMPRLLEDVYTQFEFLLSEEGIMPNLHNFRARFPHTLDSTREERRTSLANCSEFLNPFFFRVNKDRLNLPPQTFNDPIVIEMHPIQRRIYNIVGRLVRAVDGRLRNDFEALRRWRIQGPVFMIEAATDPSLLPTENQFVRSIIDTTNIGLQELLENYEGIDEENPPSKLVTAMELAFETIGNGGKVVIWCSFLKTINKLERMFDDVGIPNEVVFGAVPADEDTDPNDNRVRRIDNFLDNDDVNVLIANPATLAESVSLQRACHHAIYVDRTHNGGHWMQSQERIHRLGLAAGTVTTYDIIQSARSIDQTIHERLGWKQENIDLFLNSADLAVGRLAQENNAENFANPVGEENELEADFRGVLEHIDRDIPDE